MTITEHTLIADITTAVPSSVRVFQRHGVDFCCGGRTALAAVCRTQGLSFPDIAREIELSAAKPADAGRDWMTTAALPELIDHIVATYHDALREELPRLESMAARVAKVHGSKAPRVLDRIEFVIGELSMDLTGHMRKEELVLFPAIQTLERTGACGLPLAQVIRAMEGEHDRAGELLAELRSLTEGYQSPEWACATTRALYQGLADLESAMHVHVHLENNILFPRALRRLTPPPSARSLPCGQRQPADHPR
jgi:regulator of cell morphogenesis and NO signaling